MLACSSVQIIDRNNDDINKESIIQTDDVRTYFKERILCSNLESKLVPYLGNTKLEVTRVDKAKEKILKT